MPGSRIGLILLLLAPAAWGGPGQPWIDGELRWLSPEAEDERPPREARLRPPPERFKLISADGNFVLPREQRGDEAGLMAAVNKADVEAVRAALKGGANPNIGDYWHDLPLIEAVRQDNIELVQFLLDAGAVANVKGRGYTPLGLAAKNGNVMLVEMLLRAGANPDRKSDDGDTPAHAAALMGYPAVIDALARFKPDLQQFNREGLSPLAVAAANGQYAAVQALVRAGAPLDWGDRKFHTPLWWAFSVGDLDMARLLVRLGAAPGQLPVGTL
jgi:ankyrin repeat protein